MKPLKSAVLIPFILLIIFACNKKDDEKSERFVLLTSHAWKSDSLLADGVEAGDEGQLLYPFSGEARFKEDGTGYVGRYPGTWSFNPDETQIIIVSDSLPSVATAVIDELTETSLKLVSLFITNTEPSQLVQIRLTYKPL